MPKLSLKKRIAKFDDSLASNGKRVVTNLLHDKGKVLSLEQSAIRLNEYRLLKQYKRRFLVDSLNRGKKIRIAGLSRMSFHSELTGLKHLAPNQYQLQIEVHSCSATPSEPTYIRFDAVSFKGRGNNKVYNLHTVTDEVLSTVREVKTVDARFANSVMQRNRKGGKKLAGKSGLPTLVKKAKDAQKIGTLGIDCTALDTREKLAVGLVQDALTNAGFKDTAIENKKASRNPYNVRLVVARTVQNYKNIQRDARYWQYLSGVLANCSPM